MSSYFLDWDSTYREMRDLCIRANSRSGNRIIVGSVTEKESVEGFFWANKIEPVVEVIVDNSKFLTGFDIYLAMWDGKTETSKEEYDGLSDVNKTSYDKIARQILETINKKGGW